MLNLLKHFFEYFSISAYITMKNAFSEKRKREEVVLKDFKEKYDMMECGFDYYDKDKVQYTHNISNLEELKDFLENVPRGYNEDYKTGYRINKYKKRIISL